MSLILDALKKSEQERRRERGPDLQSIHRPVMTAVPASRRNGWLLLGVVLIALNGIALAWWLGRDRGSEVVVASASSATVPVAASESVATPVAVSPPPQTAPITSPIPAPVAAPPPADAATDAEFTSVTPGGGAVQPLAPVQELWELPEPVRRNLPPMTYSFHVYSSDPQRRTIIINNRRLREGEQVADDLVLEEITSDGVILAVAGYRVHVAVLGEW